jgi:hypothetical protein
MSEKIYAWLLRLFPATFREAYGDEALQLFRDRARDEKGFPRTLRLWFDLLGDLAVSLPRLHGSAASAVVRDPAEAMPSFLVLESGSLSLGVRFCGVVLALAAFSACSFLISHAGRQRYPNASMSMFVPAAFAATGDSGRGRVVNAVIENLKQHYFDADLARKMADALLAHQNLGDYDAAPDNQAFADLLTKHIREVSQDMHLDVVYSASPLPNQPPGPTPERLAGYRAAMERQNCTFESVKMLPHSIGYLKLNSFPDPAICQSTATAAMASLNHAEAVIFDLRDNGGGYPGMVRLMAAYLFDHPEFMFSPRDSITEQSWTQSPVPGNSLADKPVYLLTSGRTFSGAEQFAYDLKMLKRATLVGETTRGGAHAGVFHRIDEHFGMGIPETRTINPFSKHDWEGVGVEPDVQVQATEALETAVKLAENKLQTGLRR